MSQTIAPAFITRPNANIIADYPQLVSLAKQLSIKYVYDHVVSDDDLQQVGALLWQALNIEAGYALYCAKQSVEISNEYGDKFGICNAKVNLGVIYMYGGTKNAQGAIDCWIESYLLAKDMGLTEVLNDLTLIAKNLGGADLNLWEKLSKKKRINMLIDIPLVFRFFVITGLIFSSVIIYVAVKIWGYFF